MLIIRIQSLGDVTIFHCAGRLTFGSEDTVLSAVSKWPAVDLAVLDLAEVTAIDAAGLGALVSLRNWIKTKGATLKLMNVTRRVEKLLELSNLRSVFEFCSVPEMLRLLCRAFERSQFGDLETEAEGPRYLTQPAEAITPVPECIFHLERGIAEESHMPLTHTPETTLDIWFSDRDAVATEWDVTHRALETAELFWICTVRADGRPHLTPIVAAWLDSSIYFCTGVTEQKAVNLSHNAHVILTTGCIIQTSPLESPRTRMIRRDNRCRSSERGWHNNFVSVRI